MKKIIILLVCSILFLAGCDSQSEQQILANQSQFNVVFNEINHEKNTASFTVSGLPNEEEFAQIEKIVLSSMDASSPEKDTKYTVSVYTDLQSNEEPPIYGTLVYQNKAIVESTLKNITQEQYIELSEAATVAKVE